MSVVGKGDNIKIPKINDENSDDIEKFVKYLLAS